METRAATAPAFFESFVAPLGLLFVALAAICFNYHSNALLLLALLLVLGASLAVRPARIKYFLAALALPFGTLGEYICTAENLWVYANPSFIELPVWLPLAWPILIVNFWQMAVYADAELERRLGRVLYGRLARVLQLLLLIYGIGTLLSIMPGVAVVLAVFLALVLIFANKVFNWVFFAIAAAGGSAGEAVCIQFGVWEYTYPAFREIGFPISLPLAWGISANIIWLLARLCAREPAPVAAPA